mmetsp:Transcript_34261/g.54944  ORF Transcript_34261/g.54944 Transcript_34261/m.54944 type:complete len:86 (-) Transcript_34261:62-319(-)
MVLLSRSERCLLYASHWHCRLEALYTALVLASHGKHCDLSDVTAKLEAASQDEHCSEDVSNSLRLQAKSITKGDSAFNKQRKRPA